MSDKNTETKTEEKVLEHEGSEETLSKEEKKLSTLERIAHKHLSDHYGEKAPAMIKIFEKLEHDEAELILELSKVEEAEAVVEEEVSEEASEDEETKTPEKIKETKSDKKDEHVPFSQRRSFNTGE